MLQYRLTIEGEAPDFDALMAKARFAVHVSGTSGKLNWGANGNLQNVEMIGPEDHKPETPGGEPELPALPVLPQAEPAKKRTRKPAATKKPKR